MDKKVRYNPNCAMCQGKGFYTVGNTFGTQSTTHNCNCHVFYDIKENSQDLDTDIVGMVNKEFWNLLNDMKPAEEIAKEMLERYTDNLSISDIVDDIVKIRVEAYNQALEDAAKSAVAYDTVPRVYSSCVVDKQSILKLKK